MDGKVALTTIEPAQCGVGLALDIFTLRLVICVGLWPPDHWLAMQIAKLNSPRGKA